MQDKIVIEEFKAHHLDYLELQDMQSYMDNLRNSDYGNIVEERSLFSYSLINKTTNETLAIAGALPVDEYNNTITRAEVWSLISTNAGKHMIRIHRAVLRALDTLTIPRIEAKVDREFKEGIRWIEMLGFQFEGNMRKYRMERDHLLYARIN